MDTRTEAERLAKHPYMMSTSIDLTTDGHPVYFAHAPELEGCFGQGETPEAAIQDLRLALVDYIESLLIDGLPVPRPTPLSPTISTASLAAFTFVEEDRKLQPKPSEANRASYILTWTLSILIFIAIYTIFSMLKRHIWDCASLKVLKSAQMDKV